MKPCNFPARKLARQQNAKTRIAIANKSDIDPAANIAALSEARNIRTKKDRRLAY